MGGHCQAACIMTTEYDLDTPGTIRIFDDRHQDGEGTTEITLIPTPSHDPEDPLNWSRGRKNLHLACLTW
jgi:hypothetical protein